jgi:thiol-disulfide isomerase/thioredoxin
MLDGTTASLSDYRGKPIILNFWATWCGPCRVEIPALEAASQKHRGEAVFIGVDIQEDALQVADFAGQLGMTYPVLLDTTAETAQLYRVRAFPTTIFIDGRGVVMDIYIGPLNEPLLATRIQQLLETSQ